MAGETVIGALRADFILNTAQLETGAGRSRTVLDSINQSLMKTAGAAEGSGAAFKRLLEKFDPLEAATGRFTRAKKELNRALAAGLGDDLYAAHLQRLEGEYESTKAALDPLNIALKKNADIVSQLEAKFDPLSVATKKFNSDLAELNDAKIILNLDADKYEAALARLTLQFEKTKASLQSLGGADTRALRDAIDGITGVSSGGFYSAADSASVFSAEIDRLRAEFDPAFASSKKFTSALDELDRAHQLGAISAGKHKAAVERLAAEFQGPISSGVRKSAADMDAFASEIDQLEAKFDPLSVATRRYNNDLDELKRAQITLGLSSEQVAAQQRRLAANFEFNKQAINGFGASAQQAGFHSTNLFFQLQDITTMLASGQSPFVLAMQQGPQVVGIFEQIKSSGGSMGATMKSALMALVSSTSLLTIGAIAAGAALVYWLTGAEEKARTLDESLGDLSGAVGELKSITDLLSDSDLSGLTEQYGALTQETLNLLEAQRQFAIMDATQAAGDAIAAAASAMNGWITTELDGIKGAFDTTIDNARRLQQLMGEVQAATTPEEALAATAALRQQIEGTVGPLSGLKGEAGAMARALVEAELNLKQAVLQSERAEAALAGAKTQAQALAGAAPGTGWMSNAIGETNLLIGKLIQARSLAKVDAVGTQGLAAQYAQYGAGRAAFEGGAKEAFNPLYGSAAISALRVSERGGGGGGGGGGAAKAMSETADSVKKLNEAFEAGETPIAKFSAELKKLDELKLKGLSDGAYAEGVRKLNVELGKSSKLSDVFGTLVDSLLSGGNPFDALANDFKKSLGDMTKEVVKAALGKKLSASLMGSTAAGGSVGGGGGFLGGLGNLLGGGGAAAGGGGGFLGGLGNLLGGGAAAGGGALGGALGALGGPIGIAIGLGSMLLGNAQKKREEEYRQKVAEIQAANRERETIADMEIQLMRLQGKESEALSAQRYRESNAMTDAQRAIYQQIIAQEDLNAARQREADYAGKQFDLEQQLLRAQGNVDAALSRERYKLNSEMEAGLRPLYQQLIAQEDLNAARAKEAEAAQAAAALAETRFGMEMKLLRLRGEDDRALSLERYKLNGEIDESLRALHQEIIAQEDLKAAADKAKESIESINQELGKLTAEQFASALDFARARGRAAAGLRVVGGTSVSASTVAAEALAAAQDPVLASVNATMVQVLNFLRSRDEDRALRVKVVP